MGLPLRLTLLTSRFPAPDSLLFQISNRNTSGLELPVTYTKQSLGDFLIAKFGTVFVLQLALLRSQPRLPLDTRPCENYKQPGFPGIVSRALPTPAAEGKS